MIQVVTNTKTHYTILEVQIMANPTTLASISALKQYNHDYSKTWDFGTNWTNVSTDFETFINKYLFPKLNETALHNVALGNRFEWLAKEIDFSGQYSEERSEVSRVGE